MRDLKLYLALCCMFSCSSSFGQFEPMKKDIVLIDSMNWNFPREKLFIHHDRPYYNVNDTVWIKGYILSAKDNIVADSSRITYIEILTSSGELIKRTSAYSSAGIFYSNIRLHDADFKQGSYLLRAYTNYMRNYGDSLFFESRFRIINPRNQEWNLLVHSISLLNKRFVLAAAPQSFSGQNSPVKNMSVVLRAKNRVVFRQTNAANQNGNISIDTIIDRTITDDTLQLEVSGDGYQKIQLPVYVNQEQKIDLQFMAEGGSFVAGKRQQLGFKAIDIFGKGITVKGRIENSRKEVTANFSSIHNGMGIVSLTPEANERYTAILDNGLVFALPIPKLSGTVLHIMNEPASDSIIVEIDASADLYDNPFFFKASAKGITCAMGIVRVRDKPYRLSIPKKEFPSGICRFTLFDNAYLPVNERAALVWHRDTLRLNVTAHQPIYGNRDSVHLAFRAKNIKNEPAVGSFSIAVIDTGKVEYSKHAENIISYMLLSSDLRGNIENPAYYFDAPLPQAIEALLLTQGWVQYDRFISKPAFAYEKEFIVTGKVLNVFNKPVPGSQITLLGKDGARESFIINTETGKNGIFTINNFPRFITDSLSLLIKGSNKRGKQLGIGVEVDWPVFPGYRSPGKFALQQNISYDSSASRYVRQLAKRYAGLQNSKEYLPEVILTSRAKVKGSYNLNDDGGADQVITTKTLETMPKKSLLDVLKQQVKGFYRGTLRRTPLQIYKVNTDLVVFVIDGYNINRVYEPNSPSPTAFIEYLDNYLQYIAAEEIVGIEIMNTSRNRFAYEREFNLASNALLTYTFIEVTTYSGNGAFSKKIPGMYLYKPLAAPVIAKTFYSPRYQITGQEPLFPDHRSTLYWKPDIITNEKGEAEFSFYTSDSPTGYLVIVQGTDMMGGLGVVFYPLLIKQGAGNN